MVLHTNRVEDEVLERFVLFDTLEIVREGNQVSLDFNARIMRISHPVFEREVLERNSQLNLHFSDMLSSLEFLKFHLKEFVLSNDFVNNPSWQSLRKSFGVVF